MADLERLKFEEISGLLNKERLKHAVDRVLETQEVLARSRLEHKAESGNWEVAKAKVTFNYYMNVLGTLLKEKEAEIHSE
ncbi:MAG: hypothetical protein HY512_03160 [Candidatus Aenigmarchaeota archaeon]|nr:hypothetical protein [Candidatus Aenigmarchaeota archaeon]